MISQKVIGRLSLYRRLLKEVAAKGIKNIYSHQMAAIAGSTAPQVRRDLMSIGYNGSPTHGYEVAELTESIARFLDSPVEQKVALVGIGNLGRAILIHFSGKRPNLNIVAAFDSDPNKVNRVYGDCRCYPTEKLDEVVKQNNIEIGIIAVPASEAQAVAEKMTAAGIKGILNFAPAPLKVPAGVFVEDIDLITALEKVAYFAKSEDRV